MIITPIFTSKGGCIPNFRFIDQKKFCLQIVLISFCIRETLIEEHILGIPADVLLSEPTFRAMFAFKKKHKLQKNREKFRRTLYHWFAWRYAFLQLCHIIPTHYFDQVVYRIRPIDFDQHATKRNT